MKKDLCLADRGSPPRAEMIGADKAERVSLVPFASAKALPHKTSDELSKSATINPLLP